MSRPDLEHLLVSRDVRPTRQRLAVLAELAREPNDATAQTIWQRMRRRGAHRVGLATVYRTLTLLHQRGVVDALSHLDNERCYRLCTETHHHHLVCDRCHRVVEIEQCDLGGWVDEIAARNGFIASRHEVEINGLCAACRQHAG